MIPVLVVALLAHVLLAQAETQELDELISRFASGSAQASTLRQRGSELLKRLADPAPEVRAATACLLGAIRLPGAGEALVRLLEDPEPEVRSGALLALQELRSTAGLAVARLLEDPDDGVRTVAVRTVGGLRVKEAVPMLRKILGDRSPETAVRAAEALATLEAREAADDLLAMAGSSEVRRAVAAIDALRAIRPMGAAPVLLALTEKATGEIRAHLFLALARLGSREALTLFEKGLGDRDSAVRGAAVRALGELDAANRAGLISSLLRDRDDGVRTEAIYALGELGARGRVHDLVACLDDENQEIVAAARWALGRLGTEVEIRGLTALLKDPEASSRQQGILALAELGARETGALIAPLLEDPVPYVRTAAVRTLGRFRSKESIPALLRALAREDRGDPVPMWTALLAMDPATARKLLTEALSSGRREEREAAASLLARSGEPAGLAVLRESTSVRNLNALNALRQPREWERLGTGESRKVLRGRRRDLLAEILESQGLALRLPRAFSRIEEAWLNETLVHRPLRGASPLELLGELAGDSDHGAPFGFVLDEGSLRLLPAEELQAFWSRWTPPSK
jgi:HEAT repeat protein